MVMLYIETQRSPQSLRASTSTLKIGEASRSKNERSQKCARRVPHEGTSDRETTWSPPYLSAVRRHGAAGGIFEIPNTNLNFLSN